MEEETRREILKICMSKGFLLDKEMLELFSVLDEENAKKVIEGLVGLDIQERVITKSLFSRNIEKIRTLLSDGKNKTIIEKFFINFGYVKAEIEAKVGVDEDSKDEFGDIEVNGKVKVLSSPVFPPKKIVVKDFVNHFRARYETIKNILEARGLEGLTSIRKIGTEKRSYTIIAAVLNKRITKNKNLFLEVEDLTGSSIVLVNQNKQEIFDKAKELLVDDIVAFNVNVGFNGEMLFANDVIFPDSSLGEKKRAKQDEWVAFTSDLHIGSSMFLEKNVLKFIKWLNGEEGDERQREIAKKVKYLFFTGDNIDGVGHHPGQEPLLDIKDARGQYKKLSELLKLIRSDIKIILGPGQHDGVWVGEPQPIVGEDWAPDLHKIKNLTLVPNPAMVEIDGGFKVLMYHGASMNQFIDEIADIRLNYGHDSPTRVAKEMLKRRHLAPMHGSCDYIPCEKEDPLVIKSIPDIFATGDQHRPEVSNYNNILLIASSCWQSITPFEEKVGNNPDPCKVPLLNLKTREIKIMDFSDEVGGVEWEEKEELYCNLEDKCGVESVNSSGGGR